MITATNACAAVYTQTLDVTGIQSTVNVRRANGFGYSFRGYMDSYIVGCLGCNLRSGYIPRISGRFFQNAGFDTGIFQVIKWK